MNRKFLHVIAGGFGTSGSTGSKGFTGEAHEISAVETAEIFKQKPRVSFLCPVTENGGGSSTSGSPTNYKKIKRATKKSRDLQYTQLRGGCQDI